MSYVDENLMSGEKVVRHAGLHWGVFVPSGIVAAFGVILMLGGLTSRDGSSIGCIAGFFILLGLLGLGQAAASYMTTEFAVTDKRIIAKTGLLRRRSLELMLGKVESIGVNQPILGRIFNFGSLVVVGTGGTREAFPNIERPMEFRKFITAQLPGAQQ